MKVLSLLSKSLHVFKSHYLELLAFAYPLVLIGSVPGLISRLNDQHLLTPPPSALGFLMSATYWSAETFILVGVSQVTWQSLREQSFAFENLLLDADSIRPVALWAILLSSLFFAITIAPMDGGLCDISKCRAFPIMPLFFYMLAFVPLLIVDRRLGLLETIKETAFAARKHWFGLIMLSVTAEFIYLVIVGIYAIIPGETFVLVDYFGISLAIAIASIINASMMAAAYAELFENR